MPTFNPFWNTLSMLLRDMKYFKRFYKNLSALFHFWNYLLCCGCYCYEGVNSLIGNRIMFLSLKLFWSRHVQVQKFYFVPAIVMGALMARLEDHPAPPWPENHGTKTDSNCQNASSDNYKHILKNKYDAVFYLGLAWSLLFAPINFTSKFLHFSHFNFHLKGAGI